MTANENPPGDEIYKILSKAETIAVVGASSNPDKTSHAIMKKLQQWGYQTIPVNPNETEILGEKCYPDLASVPEKIDIVDVFRRPEYTPGVARDAVKAGAKVLWLQQGIASDQAAAIARDGGLTVIMDYCIAVAHSMLHVPVKK
jgi:predicted CoA-binding protein